MRTSQIVCSGYEMGGSVRGTVECVPCVYMYVCVCVLVCMQVQTIFILIPRKLECFKLGVLCI